MNFGKRANFVKVSGRRILDARIELGNYTQQFFVAGQRIDESQRALTPYGKG
jgi:hypothetical protein